jgi:hypothetical protein
MEIISGYPAPQQQQMKKLPGRFRGRLVNSSASIRACIGSLRRDRHLRKSRYFGEIRNAALKTLMPLFVQHNFSA